MTPSQANVAAEAATARRTRRLSLRRFRRPALGLLIALAVLYAVLPWLIPKQWLADVIAGEIALAMNRATRIDSLGISWTEGVVIRGLTIDRRAGFGRGPFVTVRRIQTDFSPLAAVLGRPITKLGLVEPEAWVVIVTEDGVQRLNISDLGQEGTADTPTGDWSAINAVIHIVEETTPDGTPTSTSRPTDLPANHVSLRLGQLACRLDAETGQANWEIRGQAPSGDGTSPVSSQPGAVDALSTDGMLTVPKLKKGAKLSGGGRIVWKRLDLATLPVHLIPGGSLQRLTGWSEGMLDVRVHEDLELDVEFRAKLSDLSAYHSERDLPDRLESADLNATGNWNPSADVLIFSRLDCRLPGVRVRTPERPGHEPIRFALHSEPLVDMELTGEVDDIERLRRSLPELDRLLGPDTLTRGAFDFDVRWRRLTTGDRLALGIDAAKAEIVHADAIRIPIGEQTSLRVDMSIDHRADAVDLRELEMRVGPMTLRVNGRTSLDAIAAGYRKDADDIEPASILEDMLHGTRGEIQLHIEQADRIRRCFPVLDEPLRDVRLDGPVNLVLSMAPGRGEAGGTTFRGELDMPESADLTVGEAFAKPSGKRLSASVQLLLLREPRGTLRELGLDVRCGDGRLRIDPGSSRARLAVQRAEPRPGDATSREGVERPNRFMAHAYAAGTVHVTQIEALLASLPSLARQLSEGNTAQPLTGDCTLRVEANLASLAADRQMRPELWRIHAFVSASGLGIDFGEQFGKPAGKRASVAWDYFYDRSPAKLQHRHAMSFEVEGLSGVGEYVWGDGHELARLDVDVADVPGVLSYAADSARRAKPYRLRGSVGMTLRSRRDPHRHVMHVDADATGLGFHLPRDDAVDKVPGVPCRLSATVESLPETDANRPNEMTIRQVAATLASCQLHATEGRIVTGPGTHRKLSAEYMAKHPRWWLTASPFREIRLKTVGKVVFDSTLRRLSPAIDRMVERYDLIGSAEAEVRLRADPEHLRLAGRIDAGRTHINASPHLIKPTGTEMALTFDVATRENPDRPETTTGFVVHQCDLLAWDMRLTGSGGFWLQHDAERSLPRLGGFAMSATYDVPELSHLRKLAPALMAEPLSGAISGSASLVAEGEQVRLETSTLKVDGAETTVGGERIRVNGEVSVSSDRVESEGLDVEFDGSRVTLAGCVDDITTNPSGSVFLIAEEMDLDKLLELPGKLQSAVTGSQPAETATRPAGTATQPAETTARPAETATQPAETATVSAETAMQPAGTVTGSATIQTIDQQRMARAQPFFELLKRCDITGRMHIGRARVRGEKTKKIFVVDELTSDFKLASGRIVMPFRCVLNGGLVDGKATLTADKPNPSFDLEYRAVAMEAQDNIRAMVLYDFPGLHSKGDVTLIDETHQNFFNEPNVLNHPVGVGELIIEGGTYVGRAAPIELARLLPGLNTARYEFVRMHDWFKKHIDGRVDHHMIYQGAVYNIYMKGHSLVDGWSFYEVGIDLLAGYDSKYWSETGQGRVAIFTARAKVENGVEVEKIIRFVPPHRVLYDVLKSNMLTTAYFALKKQVTNQQ